MAQVSTMQNKTARARDGRRSGLLRLRMRSSASPARRERGQDVGDRRLRFLLEATPSIR